MFKGPGVGVVLWGGAERKRVRQVPRKAVAGKWSSVQIDSTAVEKRDVFHHSRGRGASCPNSHAHSSHDTFYELGYEF